jgi:asparaginyl-tRNA synthetase
MELAEDFILFIIGRVLERNRPELEILERDAAKLELIKKPFPRLHYNDAAKLLQEKGVEFTYGDDFGAPQEEALTAGSELPVFIHRFPTAIKAFYMKRDPEDPTLSLSADLLAPEGYGEIIGGSQREDDLAQLEARIAEHHLPREAFEWYLDVRRYGTFPHSGFGLGLERTVSWITGVRHIRECIPFPRLMYRLKP